MVRRETAEEDQPIKEELPLEMVVSPYGGQPLWIDRVTGRLFQSKPIAPTGPFLRGGILAEEMGLGKTVGSFVSLNHSFCC